MNEVELKLQLPPESAGKIAASDLLAGKGRRLRLRSVYFDTADAALASAGMSLRIRRSGSHRVQTIKAAGAGAAGLFDRQEWEASITTDLPQLDDSTPVLAHLHGRPEDLRPVWQAEVTRRIWTLAQDGARIEVALDEGELRAGDRRSPVCEIELDLKSGPPQPLFALARNLAKVAPLRLGVLSKSARGKALTAALPVSVKSSPIPLTREMTAEQAFQAIAQACLTQFRRNEELIFPARSAEALHQARVALRRLRSAFSVVKPLLGADQARDLRDGLKRLAGQLGPARDLDVLLDRAPDGPLRQQLLAEREAAYDRVQAALDSARTRSLMLDLVEWLHCGPWLEDAATDEARQAPARDFAADALRRFRRKVKKGGRHLARQDDASRHELRKDAKKLRYAAEFFAALFDGKHETPDRKEFLAALERVQDRLGELNDLATAPELLAQLGVSEDPEAETLRGGGKKSALLAKAAKAHGKLVEAERYWR